MDYTRNKYIGTYTTGSTNYIYEITDNINDLVNPYEVVIGDPYPNNTSLRSVGLIDGFFSMGQDYNTGKSYVAKLSTCANFKLDVGNLTVNMKTGQTIPSRTITHTGNKGSVSYQWVLRDITPGGSAISNWDQLVKSGNNASLPAQEFNLAPGKEKAVLQYAITAIDEYDLSGVPQSCQQSYNIVINVFKEFPDNIIIDPSGCIVPFEEINFNIVNKWSSADNTASHAITPLVGDVDGDGIPEIFVIGIDHSTVYVLDGETGETKAILSGFSIMEPSGGWIPAFTGALVDSDRNGWGELIFADRSGILRSYEAKNVNGVFSMELKWQSTTTFQSPSGVAADNLPQPVIADFNGDGIPEVVVFNQIYNAMTGEFMGYTEPLASAYVGRNTYRTGNRSTNFLTTVDIDGDGLPEIIAGGKIYKVNITGNTATCTILYQNTAIPDGFTTVADVDMDGLLDVVVVGTTSALDTWLYVWSPLDNRMIDSFQVYQNTGYNAQSFPFVGDIDGVVDAKTGKKYPEICVTIVNMVKAYKYNSDTGKYVEKWSLPTTDASGGTGITLFDFNNDGISELIYRDQTELRILDGSSDDPAKVAQYVAKFDCVSGTAFEYPVIADIDGDGSANICVTCNEIVNGNSAHKLKTYESATEPWAPTRPVWNQINYEATLINNDLTVPVSPIPKNTQFVVNGEIYTPFNGSLIQVPIIDLDMNIVVEAADPYVIRVEGTQINDTQARIEVVIGNQGVKNVNSSLPIALYKGSIASANLLAVKPIGSLIQPGQTLSVFFDIDIENFSSALLVRLQDDGTTYPALGSFLDCDMDNNTFSQLVLLAVDDHYQAVSGIQGMVNVLQNDYLSVCDISSITLDIVDSPVNGTVSLSGKQFIYIPDAGYEGNDVFSYEIICGTTRDTAIVAIQVIPVPDNISEEDCYIDPPAQEWTITEVKTQSALYGTHQPVFVGDIDDDGEVELITTNSASTKIIILDKDANLKKEVDIPGAYQGIVPVSAIAKIKWTDGSLKTVIFTTATASNYIRAYDIDGNLLWTASAPYTNSTGENIGVGLLIVDLDGDGLAEIVCGNKVFAAETGALILNLSSNRGVNHGWGYNYLVTATADIFNLGRQQICIGNEIYDVKITNRNGVTNNSMEIISTITPVLNGQTLTLTDGCTQIVDFDLDGNLDVVVSIVDQSTTTGYVYIWSPVKNEIIASVRIPDVYKKSVPLIGDIDGDGYSEIVFIHGSRPGNELVKGTDWITALKYNSSSATKELTVFWQLEHSDTSGSTAITLFDFNQDGIAELVYRDETLLRIINGSGKHHLTGESTTAYNLTNFACLSSTGFEYPVIADIDGDGQAEILITGSKDTENGANGGGGVVRIFKSDGFPWAPARPVWNQYSYNAVNVNDDLTIPPYPLSPGTVFAGKDGILGTADDVRPYNGFLMQQTILSTDGLPLFLTPKAVVHDKEKIRFYYDNVTDTLTISDLYITNEGSAPLNAPVKISVYKTKVDTDSLILTHSYTQAIEKDETHILSFDIPDFSFWLPVDGLVIRVNDGGDGFSYQIVCDSSYIDNFNEAFSNLPLDALAWADNYRKCEGGNVQFDSSIPETSGANYIWYHPDGLEVIGTQKSPVKGNLTIADLGKYVLHASDINTNLTVRYTLPHLSVAPHVMYWRSDAKDHNWNNIYNWSRTVDLQDSIHAIPAECTQVHLPGGRQYYPSLDTFNTDYTLYDKPVVDRIVHHFSSELGYPHLLKYERAVVQYNFGYYGTGSQLLNADSWMSDMMLRDRWYLLATPLKKMASGDFSLMGYPFTWQSLYNSYIPGTEKLLLTDFSTSFNNNATDLRKTNHALAIKVAGKQDVTGYRDHTHLESLQGIFEIPYYDNAQIVRPGHEYNSLRGESYFYYFDPVTLLQSGAGFSSLKRGEESYRYIFEDEYDNVMEIYDGSENVAGYSMNVSVTEGVADKHIMIANPFVSSIDPALFYAVNAGVLDYAEGFQLFDGLVWQPYGYDDGRRINSFEAFVVTLLSTSGNLLFPLEGEYALTGPSGEEGLLDRLPASLDVNFRSIGTEEGVKATLGGISKNGFLAANKLIFNQSTHLTEPFFIDPVSRKNTSLQSYQPDWNSIGIGLKYPSSGGIYELTFSGVTKFASENAIEVILIDQLINMQQDLSVNPVYRFSAVGNNSSEGYNVDRTRLLLKFIKTGEEIREEDNSGLWVNWEEGVLKVTSTDGISAVSVYTVDGKMVYTDNITEDVYYYSRDLILSAGIYIVKAEDKTNRIITKKIIAY